MPSPTKRSSPGSPPSRILILLARLTNDPEWTREIFFDALQMSDLEAKCR